MHSTLCIDNDINTLESRAFEYFCMQISPFQKLGKNNPFYAN